MSVDGGPLFNLSAVVNREGWLLGAHAVFDVARNKFLVRPIFYMLLTS